MSDNAPFLGRGWHFPLTFDVPTASVRMVAGSDNIAESIDLLLSTLRGSRALLPEFGSDLSQFVFRRANAQMLSELESAVRFILLHDEPRIVVDEVRVVPDADGSVLQIQIAYEISQTNTRHNHVFPFASLEGSHLAPAAQGGG